MTHKDPTDIFGPPVHIVTRADLLADGQLVDISETARAAGFITPCALSAAVWHLIETIPDASPWQDVASRLWDVLWMALLHARRHRSARVGCFQVILATPENVTAREDERLVTLKLVAGPGDVGKIAEHSDEVLIEIGRAENIQHQDLTSLTAGPAIHIRYTYGSLARRATPCGPPIETPLRYLQGQGSGEVYQCYADRSPAMIQPQVYPPKSKSRGRPWLAAACPDGLSVVH